MGLGSILRRLLGCRSCGGVLVCGRGPWCLSAALEAGRVSLKTSNVSKAQHTPKKAV